MNTDVNIPLLRKAVEWAEAEDARGDDSQWNQSTWMMWAETLPAAAVTELKCGTACCIAGWVSVATLRPGEYILPGGEIFNKSGNLTDCEDRATEQLGLTLDQASDLFDAENDIFAVRLIAEAIAGERL